jgi:hypothetical protein
MLKEIYDIIHVVPVDDEKGHTEKCIMVPLSSDGNFSMCHCEPKEEIVNDTLIVIHNSFDGREGVEWANEILQNK